MYRNVIKRIFDLIVASILLLISLPLLILLCILIRLFLGYPVIFKQLRPGLNESPFFIYKFRTMKTIYDTRGNLLADQYRITTFGKWLRSLSLDELPELINIIKGDMSLVGPRPLLMEYIPHYSAKERLRHSVRPGITGWAQINGRNALSWEKKFEYDIWYVKKMSFFLDIKIILLTMIKIIKRDGINAAGHTTMPRFDLQARGKDSSTSLRNE